MKNTLRRRTFISAIAMLIVSAIVLTSSTFAWFSMARQVQVDNMELTVTSPEGIQISANTSAWTTQLSMADLNPTPDTTSRFKADDDHTNHFPTLLIPSSCRMASHYGLPRIFQGNVSEDGTLTASQVTLENSGVVSFDIFLKVSEKQTVYWKNTKVTPMENGNAEVVYATRVGLIPCGTSTDPATAKTILSCKNGDAQIFEPVAYQHLAEVVAAGSVSNGTKVETKYIDAPITAANRINVSGTGYITNNNTYAFETYAGVVANENDNQANMKLELEPGITRVRMYMWLEGNDIDCLQSIGGSQFNFRLAFSLDE